MVNRSTLIRALIRQARDASPADATQPLKAIQAERFRVEVSKGRTVITTSEAGGSVSFRIPDSLSAAEVIELTERALTFLEGLANPNAPGVYPQEINRLRVSFARASA